MAVKRDLPLGDHKGNNWWEALEVGTAPAALEEGLLYCCPAPLYRPCLCCIPLPIAGGDQEGSLQGEL